MGSFAWSLSTCEGTSRGRTERWSVVTARPIGGVGAEATAHVPPCNLNRGEAMRSVSRIVVRNRPDCHRRGGGALGRCLGSSEPGGTQSHEAHAHRRPGGLSIPSQPSGKWALKLWALPRPGVWVGVTTGTSGTLTLAVPHTPTCQFHVDVRYFAPGGARPRCCARRSWPPLRAAAHRLRRVRLTPSCPT